MKNAPLNKGIYCILIKLMKAPDIKIGCLGTFHFPIGFYVYTGSAQKNLEQRIQRHLRKEKKFHWHIDYLLHHGQVICTYKYPGEKYRECKLNQKIGAMRNATVPVKGFGSSDCSCISHLYFFKGNPCLEISGAGAEDFQPLPAEETCMI